MAIGINKSELFEMVIETATKHAQMLYDKGKVEEAKRILIPASLSTLVAENPELSPSLETLFKWSHPEVTSSVIVYQRMHHGNIRMMG